MDRNHRNTLNNYLAAWTISNIAQLWANNKSKSMLDNANCEIACTTNAHLLWGHIIGSENVKQSSRFNMLNSEKKFLAKQKRITLFGDQLERMHRHMVKWKKCLQPNKWKEIKVKNIGLKRVFQRSPHVWGHVLDDYRDCICCAYKCAHQAIQ